MNRTRSEAIALAETTIRAAYAARHAVTGLPVPPHAARRAKRRAIRGLIQKLRAFRAA